MKLLKINALILLIAASFFIFTPQLSESEEISNIEKISSIKTNNSFDDKTIIKAVEPVTLLTKSGNKTIKARIDTGATQSSIDIKLANEMGLTNYIGKVNVISANGIKTRKLIEISYELSGKKITSTFTVADRSRLNFPILIGRIDLEGFLVDPTD